MEQSDLPWLKHMLDAVERIRMYLQDTGKATFEQAPIQQDAVIRQLEILGEAAGRVSRETCDAYPVVPWREITGLRHRLIHDYFGVDIEIVWVTATEDVPALLPALEQVVSDLSGS